MRARFILSGFSLVIALSSAGAVSAGELVISAASSLSDAFKAIAQSYEQQNPGESLVMNFGASDMLLQQIV
jgi:molybdate transport system substrate-binding protein